MTDNAYSSDVANHFLAKEYGFDAKQRRIRCFGHVLDPVAQATGLEETPTPLKQSGMLNSPSKRYSYRVGAEQDQLASLVMLQSEQYTSGLQLTSS